MLNYLTKSLPPFGDPPLTFFDVLVQKCKREFDNCLRIDPHLPISQERIKNVALMIADLFYSIKGVYFLKDLFLVSFRKLQLQIFTCSY